MPRVTDSSQREPPRRRTTGPGSGGVRTGGVYRAGPASATRPAFDDGDMWPTYYALKELTPEVEARIAEFVRTAAG
jgi:hypothetical protein